MVCLDNNQPPHLIGTTTLQSYSIQGVERKVYIPIYIGKYRVIACTDTGSDVTLIQEGLYKKILGKHPYETPSNLGSLKSFSGTSITIRGRMDCEVKIQRHSQGFRITLYIVEDIPNVPTFLFGNDSLRTGKSILSYAGVTPDPLPELTFCNPVTVKATVYYVAPKDVWICKSQGSIELPPFGTDNIEMYLHPAAPLVYSDIILVTPLTCSTITIIPSRSNLQYNPELQCYSVSVCVTNFSNNTVKEFLTGKIELAGKEFRSYCIMDTGRNHLKELIRKYPLGREIIPTAIQANIQVETLTVHKISYSEYPRNKDTLHHGGVIEFSNEDTIMINEPTYVGEADIKPEIIEPRGLDLPTTVYKSAHEAIDLQAYPPEIRPHIKDIFLDKYPQVVALHALDAGDLSKTLGYTQIRLRPGELLPKCKRIFHMSPSDTRHLEDICELLVKFGYLMRTPMAPNNCHMYGMASYLVPRAKENCLGRLIVDFSPINPLLQSPPSVIPEVTATLQFLQGKALFTSLDLKYAYMSLKLDEESRSLTNFLTPTGCYQWLSVPTGAANSPAYFTEACNKILHFEPVLDEDGKPVYETNNVVKLQRSIIPEVTSYFDDILITSKLQPTWELTLNSHFSALERVIKRLAFHGSKISVMKCEFAKAKILFLGWYVCNDYVIADPKRIAKIKEYQFPDSKKGIRAFLGVVNSLRRVVTMNIINEVNILTPLTSSTTPYKPEEKHRQAFEKIKQLMISEPLFNHLIDERAEKYLWVDAATSSGVLGAVLAQKKKGVKDEKIIPTCLDLDDPVHRIIFDKEFPYEPAKLFTSMPIVLPKPSLPKTTPPNINKSAKLFGFTTDNVHDSFFLSTASILALYNCKLPTSTNELRLLATKELKKGVLGLKM